MKLRTLLITTACLAPALVHAAPVQNPANGHWYELVEVLSTWDEAETAAASMSWMSQPGYLATITSVEEQDWIWSTFSAQATEHIWIGAFQNPADTDPPTQGSSDNWEWTTGESWSYTAWYPGEPNDGSNRPEDKVYMLFNDDGLWNDSIAGQPEWFLVEYDESPIRFEARSWGRTKAPYER